MIRDENKSLDFEYNELNLMSYVFGDTYVDLETYITYDAAGNKLTYEQYESSGDFKIDYVGSFVYKDDVLEYIITPEGRAVKSGSTFYYEYQIKDHLGNVRVTYKDNGSGGVTQLQETHYYPFGMAMRGISQNLGSATSNNKYLYSGKEFHSGIEFFDFGARYYDAQLGRWHSPDPVQQYASPYIGIGNNPVNLVDPFGMDAREALKRDLAGGGRGGERPNPDQCWIAPISSIDIYIALTYGYSSFGDYTVTTNTRSYSITPNFVWHDTETDFVHSYQPTFSWSETNIQVTYNPNNKWVNMGDSGYNVLTDGHGKPVVVGDGKTYINKPPQELAPIGLGVSLVFALPAGSSNINGVGIDYGFLADSKGLSFYFTLKYTESGVFLSASGEFSFIEPLNGSIYNDDTSGRGKEIGGALVLGGSCSIGDNGFDSPNYRLWSISFNGSGMNVGYGKWETHTTIIPIFYNND